MSCASRTTSIATRLESSTNLTGVDSPRVCGARKTVLRRGSNTVTPFELFFDLVYVFAATQVTGYMVHAHDALGVLQGLLVLALLWWTWSAYAWLGNQARADTGVVRAAMAVAMAALFVVALTIPEAWDDAEGASTNRSCWSAPTCSCGACT
jgi:hypothetical protein